MGPVDACIHFLFVTGVSKFSKVSLFSDLNNLQDITMDPAYATLVGYTDDWEVRRAMTGQIMEFVGHVSPVNFGSFIPKFSSALTNDDIALFCQHLQDFFTLIPHTIIVNREKFYQGTF